MTDVKQAPAGTGAARTTDLGDGGHNGEPAVPLGARPGNGRRPKPKAVVHLTAAERAEKGKAARDAAPRAEHGEWEPAADRRDPVELLEEQAASRVPELVPIRYGRMLVSPFTFFRGAAYPMAADLADAPRTGLDVQLCGDAHLSNFGAFGAPDRRLVFSINDFDETLPGPFEWDVKRLVASFAVAGRDRGFDAKQRRSINRDVEQGLPGGDPGVRRDVEPRPLVLADRRGRDRLDRGCARRPASSASGSRPTSRRRGPRTASGPSPSSREVVDGEPRIVSDPPLIVPIEDVASGAEEFDHAAFVQGAIRAYRRTLTPDRRQLLERYPLRARGTQGRRRRQRRCARVDRAHARPRRERSTVPAGQGSAGVGARAVRGQEQVQPSRPARRRGPAADAGGRRHHARLDPGQRTRRA